MYENYFQKVKDAARSMATLGDKESEAILLSLSKALLVEETNILNANKQDLDRMDPNDPRYDRLKLTSERLENIASDLESVAKLPVPVGEVLEEKLLPNGLKLEKKRVPLGVIGIIYESRPNVTVDVFALCLRSGNACVLKGGSDAEYSNLELVKVIHNVLRDHGVNPDILQLLPADRKATEELLKADGFVDVLIPRGSQGLINHVRENASIPVIETGAGIVHTYFDEFADLNIGQKVIFNAKTRRVSVCNALDCLVLHKSRLNDLPVLVHSMAKENVEIFADELSYKKLEGLYPDALLKKATEEDFGTEFLSYKMSIKTVDKFDDALDHVYKFSSKHSEAIISQDEGRIQRYLNEVDAAVVYVNTSTAFTDGAQFGLGAEIGISTQKLHARGPMALKELTSYKWIVRGEGHIRD
ncbi:glutamate-5-semialdehyde dehydrogenase [Carboxylicivirga linearis]|uniref:Gamma-glutamyl phosphate reductase n=1 Tax=Carboxylicivirga linearis TaxID=1628157 RepID=A0ABS5JPZ9_9BACT|nr:glutamate-5-semialdehyde dehydrogenase [Carboxylicivirga linearis]MBS2096959.1 glutamate-5-semialdehyde dehydrogenase [Carboxylicivirga linearis]